MPAKFERSLDTSFKLVLHKGRRSVCGKEFYKDFTMSKVYAVRYYAPTKQWFVCYREHNKWWKTTWGFNNKRYADATAKHLIGEI